MNAISRVIATIVLMVFAIPLVPFGFWFPAIMLGTIWIFCGYAKTRDPGTEWVDDLELWLNTPKGFKR